MDNATQIPWDKIIGAAAASTLGVLSLCVIGIGVLAYLFFGRSDDRIKLGVFSAILVAVIGLAIAVLRESQGGVPSSMSVTPTSPAKRLPASSGVAEPPVGEQEHSIEATNPPNSDRTSDRTLFDPNGVWRDEQYSYDITAKGSAISYIQSLNGERVGAGEGTISGRKLTYHFVVDATQDRGICHGLALPDGNTIEGTCINGGLKYAFTIVRAPQ